MESPNKKRVRMLTAALLPLGLFVALLFPSAGQAGQEIADLTKIGPNRKGPMDVLLAKGDNAITPEAFATYTPPKGYAKNSERTAQFNYQETLSSPGVPEPEITYVTTPDGYTWFIVAQTRSAMWPFDAAQYPDLDPPPESAWEAAAQTPTPPKGVVRYSANAKNQDMYFWSRYDGGEGDRILRYFVTDRWGNRHMMMASNMSTPEETTKAFKQAVLPKGWKKSTGYLRKTRVVKPAYDLNNNAQFNVWRDSGDNSWVQIGWGKNGRGIAQQIGDGMPIWGGRGNDRLLGTGKNDTIHGAQGNDTIKPRKGNDNVYGDGGRNTAVLPGKSRRYRVISKNRTTIKLAGYGNRKTLHNIHRIRFADRGCRAAVVRKNARRGQRPCAPIR